MSKSPEDSINTSFDFQARMISIIADEEIEGKDNGKTCSNSEFAKRVGISKNIISNITNYGIIPSVKSLIKIADYKNYSLEYLLAITDNLAFDRAETPSNFHERLLQLIKENNIHISDITNAKNVTFARNSIHVWLKRKNLPSLEFLFQISEYFHVSVDYLLGRSDDRHNF